MRREVSFLPGFKAGMMRREVSFLSVLRLGMMRREVSFLLCSLGETEGNSAQTAPCFPAECEQLCADCSPFFGRIPSETPPNGEI